MACHDAGPHRSTSPSLQQASSERLGAEEAWGLSGTRRFRARRQKALPGDHAPLSRSDAPCDEDCIGCQEHHTAARPDL